MTLAGRIKLRTFVLLAVAGVGLAGFGFYRACPSHPDGPAPERSAARTPTPSAPPPAAPTAPAPAAPTPVAPVANPIGESGADVAARPYDAEVIAWRGKKISGDKLKDVTKGKSYKVNVYQEAGQATVNRAKVDLDRDDKWDEKYTFEAAKITLQRAPADDEQYTETYHWTGDGWAAER